MASFHSEEDTQDTLQGKGMTLNARILLVRLDAHARSMDINRLKGMYGSTVGIFFVLYRRLHFLCSA